MRMVIFSPNNEDKNNSIELPDSKNLVKKAECINTQDQKGETLLHKAVRSILCYTNQQIQIINNIKSLLQKGVKIDIENKEDCTPCLMIFAKINFYTKNINKCKNSIDQSKYLKNYNNVKDQFKTIIKLLIHQEENFNHPKYENLYPHFNASAIKMLFKADLSADNINIIKKNLTTWNDITQIIFDGFLEKAVKENIENGCLNNQLKLLFDNMKKLGLLNCSDEKAIGNQLLNNNTLIKDFMYIGEPEITNREGEIIIKAFRDGAEAIEKSIIADLKFLAMMSVINNKLHENEGKAALSLDVLAQIAKLSAILDPLNLNEPAVFVANIGEVPQIIEQ